MQTRRVVQSEKMRGVEHLLVRESRQLTRAQLTKHEAVFSERVLLQRRPAVGHMGTIGVRTVEAEQKKGRFHLES